MKNKYGIGFLLFLILVVFGITCAYQLSLNKGKREIQAEINAKEQREMNDTSVAADGQALKDDCYYLKELNGYVVVYLSDKKTVYEYTDISLEDLPENLQKEIQNGKYTCCGENFGCCSCTSDHKTPVGNLKRLLSRTAMRLDNLNLLASPAIPVILKKPVILLIKLSCGIIRNINKFRLLLPTTRKSGKSQAKNHTQTY